MATRTYDLTLLETIDVTALNWARTMLRLLLKDKPAMGDGIEGEVWPKEGFDDKELEVFLALNAVSDDIETYYRPHITATQIFRGNSERIQDIAWDQFKKTYADMNEVVAAWLEQGKAFDALIPDDLLPNPAVVAGKRRKAVSSSTPFESYY